MAALDPSAQAEAIIHLAYYAMYHAAMAVLIARTDDAPKRHATVISRFGLVVKDMGQDAVAAGRSFNEAFDARMVADYRAELSDLAKDALRLRQEAGIFVQICKRLIRG